MNAGTALCAGCNLLCKSDHVKADMLLHAVCSVLMVMYSATARAQACDFAMPMQEGVSAHDSENGA